MCFTGSSQDTELPPTGGAPESTPSGETPSSGAEQDGFWNAWLSPTATSPTPELSTSLSQNAGRKKETRDRSQLKGKLGLRKKLRSSLSVQIPSPPKVESVGTESETTEVGSRVTEDVSTKVVEETPAESKPDDVEDSTQGEGDVMAQRKTGDLRPGEDEVSQRKKDVIIKDALSQQKKDDIGSGKDELSQWRRDDRSSGDDEVAQRQKRDRISGEDESSQRKKDDRSSGDAEGKVEDLSRDEDELSQQQKDDRGSCEVESSQMKSEDSSSSDRKYDDDLNPTVVQTIDRSIIGVHGTGEDVEQHTGQTASVEQHAGQTTSLEGGEVFGGMDDVVPPTTSSSSVCEEEQTGQEDNENNGVATLQTPEGCSEQTTESAMQHSSDNSNDGEMVPREDAIVLSMSSGWSEASLVTLTDQQVVEDFDACKELETDPVVDQQTVAAVASSQELPVERFDKEIGCYTEVESPHRDCTTDVEKNEETSKMKVSVAPVHSTPIVDEVVSPDLTVAEWQVQSETNASDESVTAIDDGSSHDELSESNQTLTSDDCSGSGLVSPEQHAGSVDGEGKDAGKAEAKTSGETLSSSCYVKDLLEEAMVESAKDSDSKASSTSSCRASHTESTQNSGQTSADEIDTTTSSDIEIISHISTPTPNDDLVPFDLSPLRHALSRGFPRGSGQGHARSDSSSSGASKNGEELSPEGRRDQGRSVRTGSESADAVAEERVGRWRMS